MNGNRLALGILAGLLFVALMVVLALGLMTCPRMTFLVMIVGLLAVMIGVIYWTEG